MKRGGSGRNQLAGSPELYTKHSSSPVLQFDAVQCCALPICWCVLPRVSILGRKWDIDPTPHTARSPSHFTHLIALCTAHCTLHTEHCTLSTEHDIHRTVVRYCVMHVAHSAVRHCIGLLLELGTLCVLDLNDQLDIVDVGFPALECGWNSLRCQLFLCCTLFLRKYNVSQ